MRILDESEDSPASMSMGSDMCLTPVPQGVRHVSDPSLIAVPKAHGVRRVSDPVLTPAPKCP